MTDIIRFENLSKISALVHGFSTRKFGNMRTGNPDLKNSIEEISKELQISSANIIKMQQVHGNNIEWVDGEQAGWRILQTDGLLTGGNNVYLTVLSADCVPLLIFDRKKKFSGAVHAGWRGIYNQIILDVIDKMLIAGSKSEDIIVGIGPCIRACCYNIEEERARKFEKKFKHFAKFLIERDNKYFLDLPAIAVQQLRSAGIPEKNIEDCGICTFDKAHEFFSHRKEGENFGAFMGLIGIR